MFVLLLIFDNLFPSGEAIDNAIAVLGKAVNEKRER